MNESTVTAQVVGRETGTDRWGPWEYDSTTNEIRLVDGHYEIDLNRCESSAAVLDWIFQIAKKSWAGDCVIANLVWAIDEILDPQATLCSFGVDVSERDSGDGPVAPRRRDAGEWETKTGAVA